MCASADHLTKTLEGQVKKMSKNTFLVVKVLSKRGRGCAITRTLLATVCRAQEAGVASV